MPVQHRVPAIPYSPFALEHTNWSKAVSLSVEVRHIMPLNLHQTNTPGADKGERCFWMSVSAGAALLLLVALLWPRQPHGKGEEASAGAIARTDGNSPDATSSAGIRPRRLGETRQ